MKRYYWAALPLVGVLFLALPHPRPAEGCCPAGPFGRAVVNADQTIVMVWDAANKTQHFIRRASFKSQAEDFGFLIPSPSRPELAESGDQAFPLLQSLTAPAVVYQKRPAQAAGCGCGSQNRTFDQVGALAEPAAVRVLEEKTVAGFNAKVLEADTTEVLVQWLKENGYAYSPEVAAWAKPYVEGKWKITALKVAKKADDKGQQAKKGKAPGKDVTAAALRMSFQTDRPLFPYREPDPSQAAPSVGADRRLLRIYFLADGRYQGGFTTDDRWTGRVAWAGKMSPEHRKGVLDHLRLPDTTGPAEWWLTEFEDDWPYRVAPSDVYFARSADQAEVRRPPIVHYVSGRQAPDVTPVLVGVAIGLTFLVGRLRSRG